MKAVYGTFLTSLLVIKCHDMVADQAATAYNVTWCRTTPVVVSCLDDAKNAYITGESSLRMGMDVNGTVGNVWAFRFACSSAFSPIEYCVAGDSTGLSVTLGLGERILNGEIPELFYSNGYLVYKIQGKDDLFLLLDPVTGIVTDCALGINGVYCYHDQITNTQIQLAENLTSNDPNVQPGWMDSISNSTIPLGSIIAVIGEVVAQETGITIGEVAFSTIIGYCAPILLPAVTIQLLDNLRPGAIEEAESNGSFNTAEYFRNNNSWDITWDGMLQSLGIEGPPTEVFDESNEYIRNNENVKRNLQDIKNIKESVQLFFNVLWGYKNWSIELKIGGSNVIELESEDDKLFTKITGAKVPLGGGRDWSRPAKIIVAGITIGVAIGKLGSTYFEIEDAKREFNNTTLIFYNASNNYTLIIKKG